MTANTAAARIARKARLNRIVREVALVRVVAHYQDLHNRGLITADQLSHQFEVLAGFA